jgi:hypothetical protein
MGRTIKINLYEDITKPPKDPLWQNRRYKKDDMKEYRHLCRELDKLFFVKGGFQKRTPRFHGTAFSSRQLCVVKFRRGKTIEGHRKFLTEYLPQENKKPVKEKPELFNFDEEDKGRIKTYMDSMSARHFKCIVSPENSRVDLKALVTTLVARMEKITGYRFSWVAAVHSDTAHPHAHLLINGLDKRGKNVEFNRVFLTQTIREMARQICTELIGKRSGEEIKESVVRSYRANRYGTYDDAIRELEDPLAEGGGAWQSRVRTDNESIKKRLYHLAEIGLAEINKETGSFRLERGWADKLRAIGRYNSFLAARSALTTVGKPDMELYTKESGEIGGIVTRVYKMNDEDSWNHAILVENPDRAQAWYIPLYYEPGTRLLGTEIRCAAGVSRRGLLSPEITVINRHNKGR